MKQKQHHESLAAMQQLARLLLDKVDPGLIGLGADQIKEFLQRVGSSALPSEVESGQPLYRWQDAVIQETIEDKASVLDLGCGNGELLAQLISLKHIYAQGVELDPEKVMICVEKGVPVFQIDLESGIQGFAENAFDYVVLEETLQTLKQPEEVLFNMLRVGRRVIVSFPNFGYWRVRLDLAVRGRMPVTGWLPYRWFNTPNIHLLTLQDFLDWTLQNDIQIEKAYVQTEGNVRILEPRDNIYAEEALFVLRRKVVS